MRVHLVRKKVRVVQSSVKAIQRESQAKRRRHRPLTVARTPVLNPRLQEAGDAIQDEFLEAFRRLADQ